MWIHASRNGIRSDHLHRLDCDRHPEIATGQDVEQADRHQNVRGLHLVQNDHPHREGEHGAQIAEGTGQLHPIESVTPIAVLRHYPNLVPTALAESPASAFGGIFL